MCLFAARLASGASGALAFDESKIRIFLDAGRTRVRLQAANGTGHDFNARLCVELLDPEDAVSSSSETVVRVRRGTNSFEVPLDLRYAELPESDRDEFPRYRLRYRLAAEDAGTATQAARGVVSVSGVTPDLLELRVVSPRHARA